MNYILALLLAFSTPPTLADSESSESELTRKLKSSCEEALRNTPKEELRARLIERLSEYTEKARAKSELILDQLEELAAEELKAEGQTFPIAPSISPRTMRVLLDAYGSDLQRSYREKLFAATAVAPALERDPYFRWLSEKAKTNSVAFFLRPLESTGSAHLGLHLSLMRLKAALDPSFPTRSAKAFPIVLFLHARENLALLDLASLRMNGADESWELIVKLWQVSELGLFNEHYNALFEVEKHRYPYLDLK